MAKGTIPRIKKKISSFIKDEKGSISKQSLLSLGTFIGTLAASSILATKDVKSNSVSVSAADVGNSGTFSVTHSHHGSHGSHGSHSSHCSHGSHGSHGSHSSHGSHGSHSSHSSW